MKLLLYIGLGLWFLGWLYAWVVIWAGFDIWRWFRRKPKSKAADPNGITIITISDEYASHAALKGIRAGAIISTVEVGGIEKDFIVTSRRKNTLRVEEKKAPGRCFFDLPPTVRIGEKPKPLRPKKEAYVDGGLIGDIDETEKERR